MLRVDIDTCIERRESLRPAQVRIAGVVGHILFVISLRGALPKPH